MTEKKIISSEHYNKVSIMVLSFMPGVLLFLYLVMQYFSDIERIRIWISTYGFGDYMFDGSRGGVFGISSLVCIFAGIILCWAVLGTKIIVTDKRVYGRAKFGKMVDLPLDSISAVAVGMFKTIAVSTASGKIAFGLIKNREDVYDAISKLLMERQSQKQQPTIIQEVSNSNADELKKYKDLLDNGIITAEEFEAKKKQILSL